MIKNTEKVNEAFKKYAEARYQMSDCAAEIWDAVAELFGLDPTTSGLQVVCINMGTYGIDIRIHPDLFMGAKKIDTHWGKRPENGVGL